MTIEMTQAGPRDEALPKDLGVLRDPVDIETWTADIAAHCDGLPDVVPARIANGVLRGWYPAATRDDLWQLAINGAASLIAEEPQYSRLAARLLGVTIHRQVAEQNIHSFSQSVAAGHSAGLLSDHIAEFVAQHKAIVDSEIDFTADRRFEYFSLRTIFDRYLLRHLTSRRILETPQYFFMRVACGLSQTSTEAVELYRLMSQLAYLPSSPTLFNSGTVLPQLSSCFLLDSARDELESIYERYAQTAQLSKYAGGIGISWSRVRSRGSMIRGTNGQSNGVVPWLKTLDSSVAAVNRGGRRRGAACVYLETWHADIEEFLELRDNTGEESRRTHNLNLANWVPDEFMRRVERDEMWSLFDPKDVPEFVDLWGDNFDLAYRSAEAAKRYVRQVPARQLYARMMRTLASTGNGWLTFKDASNRTSNQTALPENVIHLSNLCTEIVEVSSDTETAVCNLGSVNLSAHLGPDGMDWERLRATVRTAVRFLDRVIDLNFYPTHQAGASNERWRPVGLGVMGLADVFFRLRLPFDSPEALALSTRISEEIALAAFDTSADLAEESGAHSAFEQTRAAQGVLHIDHWRDAQPHHPHAWEALRDKVGRVGLRNSLVIAIAPTATIASIAGCYECIEPPVSNVFKRETLSGEFLQINSYLVADLKARNLWSKDIRDEIKRGDGSIQHIAAIPAELRTLYRTAWEIPQRSLIDLAAARAPYIDQSQSLNLFMATPTIGKLSSMYAYAWRKGLKTTYYLRSRPATRIAQTTIGQSSSADTTSASDAIACSLENPETCEACQ